MEELENKYIDLILNRCLNFDECKSLMIHCDFKEHVTFAEKVKEKANSMGIEDVCIHLNDMDEVHEYLSNTKVEDIKLNPIIDRSDWDLYAKKGGSLLFLNSAVPGLMDDIAADKIKKFVDEKEKSIPYYRQNVSRYTFPWCIVALPNERWAKQIFDGDDAYEQLYLTIMSMCMIDKDDQFREWHDYIEKNNYYKDKLNKLGITNMHYTNSLGTDLNITLPEGVKWINLDKTDSNGHMMIANMPSYEIFTTPDYRKTNGIVYSAKPLIYNDSFIENFSIEFKDGKVVSCNAERGEEILKELVFKNEGADALGEVALVPFDSPISNTGLVFNNTLFDENASCHLALGRGFPKCFSENNLSSDELKTRGMNQSKTHVDFMIGTDDLNIEADTKNGKVLIFKNGNFNI